MKIKTLCVGALLGALSLSAVAFDGVITLGRGKLKYGEELTDDKMSVLVCRNAREIRFRAGDGAYVSNLEVKFNNDEILKIRIEREFKPDEETDWYDFKARRCVSSVVVNGKGIYTDASYKVFGR